MNKMILASAGASVLALAACSSIQPSLGQYAIVTGHGNLSSQQVQAVVAPGDQVHEGSGTTTWYIPSDIRNYVTSASGGDRSSPQAEITGPGPKNAPGMSDYTYTYVTFEVNPAILDSAGSYRTATSFLSFCLKYACATQTPQNDDSNAALAHSSTPGWEDMLDEIMPQAIDNATRDVITAYAPDLWTQRSEWGSYGQKISANLQSEISQLDGSPVPYFCGPGSTEVTCTAPSVIVQNVVPSDSSVITAYNQEVSAQYAQAAGAARLSAAQEIYGSDASFFLGAEDLVSACSAKGVTCNIYLGNPPSSPGK